MLQLLSITNDPHLKTLESWHTAKTVDADRERFTLLGACQITRNEWTGKIIRYEVDSLFSGFEGVTEDQGVFWDKFFSVLLCDGVHSQNTESQTGQTGRVKV